jgi:large subunit ribosomal protein L13e
LWTRLLLVLHANHFRKDWQRRVKTWFDQPGRKLRRRNARVAKAAALGVRPLTHLRPAVRGQTLRYNSKVREGRGFTFAELKEAGVNRKEARGLGIVVDHRRRNASEEGKAVNVQRLKAYKERLIVYPKKASKPKKGDSTGDALVAATTRLALPLPPSVIPEQPREITEEEREFKAYRALRDARAEQRHAGVKKIRQQKVRPICRSNTNLPLILFNLTERGGGSSKEEVNTPTSTWHSVNTVARLLCFFLAFVQLTRHPLSYGHAITDYCLLRAHRICI